jgi:DNA-binding response OmpR family regulator
VLRNRREREIPIVVAIGDELTARIVQASLRDAGYEVIRADHGAQVPGLVVLHQPKVVVLDEATRRRGGLELLRQLRNLDGNADRSILFMGMSTRLGLEEEAREAGAHDYLARPFVPDELLSKVHRLYATPVYEQRAAI